MNSKTTFLALVSVYVFTCVSVCVCMSVINITKKKIAETSNLIFYIFIKSVKNLVNKTLREAYIPNIMHIIIYESSTGVIQVFWFILHARH